MFGRIGDIWRVYGRRRKTDAVNNWGVWVRRERNWLPETDTDTNTQMENCCEMSFSGLLTRMVVSDLRSNQPREIRRIVHS
jgi:hypothetical protein